MFRSFSDRSSWVVTFEQASMVPPQLAFGTSLPARHSLFTSSLVVSPHEQLDQRRPNTRLHGVVLRSRLLRLAHVMCCAELSRFVQQFLTRQVLAHPGRSTSLCVPSPSFSSSCVIFLTEVNTALMLRYHNSCKLVSKRQIFAAESRLTRPSGPS
jgi:hypothetical protein